MRDEPEIATLTGISALLADAARTRIVMALMGGQALTATELAAEAEVAPSTASSHLAKLLSGGLLALERQGRHRYFRVASPEVAAFIEQLAGFAGSRTPKSRFGPADPALRYARVCYDHLAGERGVALFDQLRAGGALSRRDGGGDWSVTTEGERVFARFGLDLEAVRRARRVFARACLDWSERRQHLGGALGAALLARMIEAGWAVRLPGRREVMISPTGEAALNELLRRQVAQG